MSSIVLHTTWEFNFNPPPSFAHSFLPFKKLRQGNYIIQTQVISKVRKNECITIIEAGNFVLFQQLRCKGSTDAYLPPWSGIDVANDENKAFQHQAEIIGQQGVGVNGQTLFAGQNTNNESTGVNVNPEDLTYSNVEDASTATNVKGQMQKTLPEQEPEPESIYEISPPSSPSKSSSPFKPLPYSVSKKGKKRQANAGDGEEKPEGTNTKQVLVASLEAIKEN